MYPTRTIFFEGGNMPIKQQLSQSSKKPLVVAIIGATGQTGQWILNGALEQGYVVRALARTPSKLEKSDNLTVIQGNVNDLEPIKTLLNGADIVLSCFGTVDKKHPIVESGMRTIIEAMHAQDNTPKLVHMSAVGLGSSLMQCKKSLVWSMVVHLAFPLIGRELFADIERGEKLIMEAKGLDFVIARAAVLNDKKAQGYKAQQAHEPVGKMMISRKDIAQFMLDAIEDNTYDGQAISLFSK